MGAKVDIKWNGAAQEARFARGTEKGLIKCGFSIERDAKIMCVVDTGRLRASISTNWTDSGMEEGEINKSVAKAVAMKGDGVTQPDTTAFAVKVGSRVEYAGYIEHGTERMDPRPFLYPAFEMNVRKLPEFIRGETPARPVIE